MELIDSHAHVYLDQFSPDLDEVIDRAKEAGITAIFMPNIDLSTVEDMLEVAARYRGYCFPMIGLHPCSVDKHFEKQLYQLEDWLDQENFMAIGEIGTDLYWDETYWEQQQEALKIQVGWGIEKQLPFVVHCRNSMAQTIRIIQEFDIDSLKGIFHCFSGTAEEAQTLTDMGVHLGIGGIATFKNGGLGPVVENTPLKNMVLETDSPYLAPHPYRGKRNEPAFLEHIARKICEMKGISIEEMGNITSENCRMLFTQFAN